MESKLRVKFSGTMDKIFGGVSSFGPPMGCCTVAQAEIRKMIKKTTTKNNEYLI